MDEVKEVETQPRADGALSAEGRDAAIASVAMWYHTIEVEPGVLTPGRWDLRGVLDRMPWPDVEGKRCLDVGPFDGQLAFELERRGAREVVAADIADPSELDWPARLRESGPKVLTETAGSDLGAGFKVAKRLLGSDVERVELSVYELSPDRVGSFDVITCGSLLLHLRDPVRALEAIRSVCDGWLLSAEQISVDLSLLRRRTPSARLRGGELCQWWIPNVAAHRLMVRSAGFEIERTTKPYAIPFGPAHPATGKRHGRTLLDRVARRVVTRGTGVPHAAVLARPDSAISR